MIPDRETLRSQLAQFDGRQQKIVGALLSVFFKQPERIREREWVVEQLTHVVLLAGDFEDVDSVQDGVDVVKQYLQVHRDTLLNASFALFLTVAEDFEGVKEEERSQERAMQMALDYFATSESTGEDEAPAPPSNQ